MLWEVQQDLPRLFEKPKSSEQPTLLVWSGATATGHYVIQYAKLAGIKVTVSYPEFENSFVLASPALLGFRYPPEMIPVHIKGISQLIYV
jgi:NADPH:quinone reductase-like Zn-dependent oxidoreductase